MNKILFVLLIIPFFSFSQNLKMSEILEIRGKDIGQIEEYLTAKKWNFIGSEKNNINFSYNQEIYGSKAESFLKVYFISDNSSLNWLSIQIHKKEKYIEYLNDIKSFGCKLIKSEIKEGNLVKTYKGKTLIFEITVSDNKNSFSNVKSFYDIFVLPIGEYEQYF
ncbi:MAG TPA: hypothetical protein PK076_00970 [Saprospiraceae bacterium]|nr:hypothetical protein [Saprospiraceae bacterium]HQW54662.1 hypothetical protein [Saprospiraceae bacterium]